MKISMKKLVRMIIYAVCMATVIIMPADEKSIVLYGIIFAFASIESIYHFRGTGNMQYLSIILSMLNISLVYSNYFMYNKFNYSWQTRIVGTQGYVIMTKICLLYFLAFLFGIEIMTSAGLLRKINKKSMSYYIRNLNFHSLIVYLGCVVILLYALIWCFDRTISGTYVSQTNAIYEYAILIFLIAWIAAPKKIHYKVFLIIYAILYVAQGIAFGDRSSAFPVILLCFILMYKKNISNLQVVFLGVIGIFGANVIGIYRQLSTESYNVFAVALSRFLYVDSLSYSFYAGVQITRASSMLDGKMAHFSEWIMSLFLGNTKKYALSSYVASFSNDFFNRGGGMSCSYFYFWFGIVGVVLSGIIMGVIAGKIFSRTNTIDIILQYMLIIFSMRWYVYFPQTYFRTCIIIPVFVYFMIKLYRSIIKKSGINVYKHNTKNAIVKL